MSLKDESQSILPHHLLERDMKLINSEGTLARSSFALFVES